MARSRLTHAEKHKKVVDSWEAVDRAREKRARGCMAGLTEEAMKPSPSNLTTNLKPLSTQELIDLVDGNEPTGPPTIPLSSESHKKKAAVKHARVPTQVTPSSSARHGASARWQYKSYAQWGGTHRATKKTTKE